MDSTEPNKHKRTLKRRPKASRKPSKISSILYPLNLIYTRIGITHPSVKEVSPNQIPAPYRSLLVHNDDMTLTLERHFGDRIVLRPLSTFSYSGWYFRRVLLVQEYSGRPVEMGAIRINLEVFDQRLRAKILKNKIPLGRILRDKHFSYINRVKAFLAITPNLEMMGLFWMRESKILYGRRTEILQRNKKIGDIVEILPLVFR